MPPSQPLTSAAAQHFVGFVETTTDALRLIMAARQGIIPRITRRLNDSERRSMIRSGAVFVFCVEESGIKRWTEGLAWSPSRIVGNFLVYREVTERNSSRGAERGPVTPGTATRSLDASGTLRANGLIKKTITVKVDGTDHHLVSYYRDEDVRLGHLPRPTTRPDIMALTIPPEMVRGTNFRHPPHIEIDSDGRARM
ncbi:Gti1/Pac2 family-domain-containing protein [Amylostereum chailletii]|nr:Gti1/Pac2 family-domain-containing protein [Amylostereum chailletii]